MYLKLTVDLKVPFQLQAGQRIDDTPVHEALREALVNTLIHADFSGRVSVLVVKRPDMFGFRNPGLMRVPLEQAVIGGNSDCRNRRLQKMFQLVGYGDHAGSGLPKIYRNWAGEHWRRPVLHELREPEQTLMELRMSSLVPQDVLVELQNRLGESFTALPELARLALITASTEGVLNHARLRQIATDHPADITKMLASLVRDGLLTPQGTGRGMVYYLPWEPQAASMGFAAGETPLTPELNPLTPELNPITPEQPDSAPVAAPGPTVISDLTQMDSAELARLRALAAPVAERGRASPELVQQTVLALCADRYLGLRALAQLLGRNPDGVDLRKRILNPLVARKQLQRAYPNPNDPRQAYSASTTKSDA